MKNSKKSFLRDLRAGPLLDTILLTAVLSVLLIRFWLHLTGYPKIATGNLHIAHMLWGGLLMLVAMVILVVFLDDRPRRLAAILGGLGFGVFIDEVGKFLTHDNDYFYQPAVSIMYVVFLLLYVAGRMLVRRESASTPEYLVNALRETGQIAMEDLDPRERDRALYYLEASGQDSPLVRGLQSLLNSADLVAEPERGRVQRAMSLLVDQYRRLATQSWFGWGLIIFFSLKLLGTILRLTELTRLVPVGRVDWLRIPLVNQLPAETSEYALAQWFQLAGGLLAGVFVALGVLRVFRDRLGALRRFAQSVVVSLCVTQVFVFYRVEWLGIGELVFNLLVLAALRFAIKREQRWDQERTHA